MPSFQAYGAERFLDTAVLSNVGRITEPLDFGMELGAASELWFSPPGHMPMGLSIGVATYDGRIFVSSRARRVVMDEAAVGRFADLFLESLA